MLALSLYHLVLLFALLSHYCQQIQDQNFYVYILFLYATGLHCLRQTTWTLEQLKSFFFSVGINEIRANINRERRSECTE